MNEGIKVGDNIFKIITSTDSLNPHMQSWNLFVTDTRTWTIKNNTLVGESIKKDTNIYYSPTLTQSAETTVFLLSSSQEISIEYKELLEKFENKILREYGISGFQFNKNMFHSNPTPEELNNFSETLVDMEKLLKIGYNHICNQTGGMRP